MKSYQNLLRYILKNGEPHEDRTGVGTRSVFGYQWQHDMQDGFPLLTTKKLPFRWIAEELFWFLSGSTDERKLRARGVDIWKEWATAEECAKFGRDEGDLGPVYGELWRNFPTDVGPVDQINNLLRDINANPNSRRLIVSGWHPHHQSRVSLPPCHTLWQVKIHKVDGISLHLYARSIDAFLGLPFNIASYALLLCLLAEASNWPLQPRKLIISFGDLHIYNNHFGQVHEQLSRAPRELPTLDVTLPIGYYRVCYSDLTLSGYDPHPKISAEVAV